MTRNIAVLGLDAFSLELFQTIRKADTYNFIGVLTKEELVAGVKFPLPELLEKAERQLRSVPGGVEAIVGYWDFPTTGMLPVLRNRIGLPTTSLESVLRCVHKYWSRCIQRRAVPDLVPRCIPFNPFVDDPLAEIDLSMPFWVKPVKAHSSILGFRIEDEGDFREALRCIRDKIGRLAEPFNHLMHLADLPPEIAAIDGYHCIAEEIVSAEFQCTLEGYVFRGRPQVYGIVDSLREEHDSAFSRYQYPTRLPTTVHKRMIAATERVLLSTGLDNEPFNIEFFYDPAADRLVLLEVNPRISKSHSPLFAMVEGSSHQEVMVEVAQGIEPEYPPHRGRYPVAAKFMVRRFEDGLVRRVPSPDEIATVENNIPGVRIQIEVNEGARLSELENQDSYSYEVAVIFVGGRDEDELKEKYHRSLAALPLEIGDT